MKMQQPEILSPPDPPSPLPPGPRLWDEIPNGVTHIAGACLNMFGRYMRQRCDWCGTVLVEYDLERGAVPVGQPGSAASWPPGALVRVDGHISAVIDNPALIDDGIQLPPDACAFNPVTQVGFELPKTAANALLTFEDEQAKKYIAAVWVGPLLPDGGVGPMVEVEELKNRSFKVTRFTVIVE